MVIKRFKAENFRNIKRCDIEFDNGVNLLYGNNAQGKTNAVEGIYVFGRGKSFRASEDKELIKFGEEGFRIYIEYEDKNGENSLEYGTDFSDELNRVIVHGVLHLIGYDDHNDEDIAQMRAKENYYLSLRELV